VNVVLISRDHRLGAILTMALPTPEDLTLLGSAAEVPDASEAAIDAVVLDLPAEARRDAYDELRQRYEGRVVVPVDNARDTNGWPPDAKRRFLVRPFQVADLIAGVQEPEETSVGERAARYRRLFRWNRQQAPAFPDLATPPAAEQAPDEPAAEAERSDEPFEADELHDNRVEDSGALVAEDDEDDEAVAEAEELDAEAEAAEVATAEEAEEEAGQVAEAEEAEELVAAEADEREEDFEAEAEDEEPLVAAGAEAATEEGLGEDEDEAETQEFVAASTQEEEVEAEEQLDAEEPAAEPGEGRVEDWEPSQEDDDLAAAWVAEAEEPKDDEEGLAAAAAGGPSTQPEHGGGLPPPLQVQAGVAMAKAVALQQWLEAEEAKRSRGRRRRLLISVAAGLVLLLAGIGIGMAIGANQPQQVSPPAAPQAVVQIRQTPPPDACSQAMDDADAVISYLVAKIRDERLSKSIQDYGAHARACRRSVRSP
jgi:hypothetical protein